VELHGFMLANYAEVNRGLLYILGGGWEFTTVEQISGRLQAYVAGHLLLPPDSTLDSVALETALEIPAGEHVPVASTLVTLTRTGPVDGEVWLHPVAFQVLLPISEGGRHAVLLSGGGASLRIPLFVRVPPNT